MVEILLSTYNGARYLKDFIDSLYSQTYKDWKLTVRDDGSIDETPKILEEICVKDPERIKLIEDNLGNLGACKSFLTLLMKAKADYIMFADQDDIWLSDKIEKTLKKMLLVEGKYGKNTPILIHTDLKVVDENLKTLSESFWRYQGQDPEYKSLNYLLVQNNVTGCTIMINKALKNLIVKVPERAIMHDWWLALVASAFGVVDYVPEATVLYRQHPFQDTGAKKYSLKNFYCRFIKNPSQAFQSVLRTLEQAEEFLKIYGDMLSQEQKDMVMFYVNLPELRKTRRIKGLIKWRLFKQGILRNLGFVSVVIFM